MPKTTRRNLLRSATAASGFLFAGGLYAANDFWTKKAPGEWSPDEAKQLLNKSPWAKTVRGEMEGAGPTIADAGSASPGGMPGRGSSINAASMPKGGQAPAESGGGPGGPGGAAGAPAPELLIRWESATPVLFANKARLPPDLAGRYTISVTGLQPRMILLGLARPGRGRATDEAPLDPAAQQKAQIEQLLHEATLTIKGHDPVIADAMLRTNDAPVMFLFGFPKQNLPIAPTDKEVTFALKLGILTIKAKFDPREMKFAGQLAV